MPIIHFATYSRQARAQAEELRGARIREGKGALIVDEKQKGEPRYLLEKIIAGEPLNQRGFTADGINWKPDPLIILVGAKAPAMLDKFEELVPGFTKKFGPVKAMKNA